MSKEKTHWKKAFNKEFLGAHDLEDGEELKLVTKEVTVRKIKDPNGQEQERNVATFTNEKIKPLILNNEACRQMEGFAKSKYIQDWSGIAVQLYVQGGVKAFGDIVEAIRIRHSQPRMEKPKLTPDSDKWAKAVESFKSADNKDDQLKTIRKHYELSPEDLEVLKTDAA